MDDSRQRNRGMRQAKQRVRQELESDGTCRISESRC